MLKSRQMRLFVAVCGVALVAGVSGFSEDLALDMGPDTDVSDHGTLNPHELSMGHVMDSIRQGETSMVLCAQGYLVTKSGRHEMARDLFTQCADAGWTGAMTWMSQLTDNGLGGAQNLDEAADWNRKAALAGDPVGQFNHGLDLIRGWGVGQDTQAGRALIDEAATQGLAVAKRLQAAEYDLDEVTPDADEWRYRPMF